MTQSAWSLIRTAVGGPEQLRGKAARFGRTLRLYVDGKEIERRLSVLEAKGWVERRPNRWQLLFGGVDMLRFVIEPAARDYYAQKGISFGFHQLLRVLDDPVSMLDPTGFLSDRDTIVGHLMQVVHLNPIYDLQLMEVFPNGLEDLEQQVLSMVEGTHPRRQTIGAIVEDPEYHSRLLDYVRRYRADPDAAPPVRQEQSLRVDERFRRAEQTFATLPGFLRYCGALPTRFGPLLRRYRRVQDFPIDC